MATTDNRPDPLDLEVNLDERTATRALLVAMAVRNAMEDFHSEHLSDEQMAELNPIIRNAIATALHCLDHYAVARPTGEFIDFQAMLIPDYWEAPALTDDYLEMARKADPPLPCQRCGRPIVERANGWTHVSADGHGYDKTCRSASWTQATGYDDALPKTWKVKPPANPPRSKVARFQDFVVRS